MHPTLAGALASSVLSFFFVIFRSQAEVQPRKERFVTNFRADRTPVTLFVNVLEHRLAEDILSFRRKVWKTTSTRFSVKKCSLFVLCRRKSLICCLVLI